MNLKERLLVRIKDHHAGKIVKFSYKEGHLFKFNTESDDLLVPTEMLVTLEKITYRGLDLEPYLTQEEIEEVYNFAEKFIVDYKEEETSRLLAQI